MMMTKVLSHIARDVLANAMVSLEVQHECGDWCLFEAERTAVDDGLSDFRNASIVTTVVVTRRKDYCTRIVQMKERKTAKIVPMWSGRGNRLSLLLVYG